MSWGPGYMYYHCAECGLKFKYALDLIPAFGESYGRCPQCGTAGIYEKDGAVTPDDRDYLEVEESP